MKIVFIKIRYKFNSNFSKEQSNDSLYIPIKYWFNSKPSLDIPIFAINYNFLLISSGIGGLCYSN